MEKKRQGSVGFYGYGSGCSGKFYSGNVLGTTEMQLEDMLKKRRKIGVEQYDSITYFGSKSSITSPKGFILKEIRDNQRYYEKV